MKKSIIFGSRTSKMKNCTYIANPTEVCRQGEVFIPLQGSYSW